MGIIIVDSRLVSLDLMLLPLYIGIGRCTTEIAITEDPLEIGIPFLTV